MDEPVWLTRRIVDTIHGELITEHGGSPGIRAGGEDLIEAALARPRHKLEYVPGATIADLAAAYLFGLTRNHGYVDGNKRVGFAAAATFLLLNGLRLSAPEPDAYDAVLAVVEGRATEAETAAWIAANSRPARRRR